LIPASADRAALPSGSNLKTRTIDTEILAKKESETNEDPGQYGGVFLLAFMRWW